VIVQITDPSKAHETGEGFVVGQEPRTGLPKTLGYSKDLTHDFIDNSLRYVWKNTTLIFNYIKNDQDKFNNFFRFEYNVELLLYYGRTGNLVWDDALKEKLRTLINGYDGERIEYILNQYTGHYYADGTGFYNKKKTGLPLYDMAASEVLPQQIKDNTNLSKILKYSIVSYLGEYFAQLKGFYIGSKTEERIRKIEARLLSIKIEEKSGFSVIWMSSPSIPDDIPITERVAYNPSIERGNSDTKRLFFKNNDNFPYAKYCYELDEYSFLPSVYDFSATAYDYDWYFYINDSSNIRKLMKSLSPGITDETKLPIGMYFTSTIVKDFVYMDLYTTYNSGYKFPGYTVYGHEYGYKTDYYFFGNVFPSDVGSKEGTTGKFPPGFKVKVKNEDKYYYFDPNAEKHYTYVVRSDINTEGKTHISGFILHTTEQIPYNTYIDIIAPFGIVIIKFDDDKPRVEASDDVYNVTYKILPFVPGYTKISNELYYTVPANKDFSAGLELFKTIKARPMRAYQFAD
jgi:hypothetical protein